MCDPAHQLSDRRELFLLHQLLGEALLVGHVADDAQRASHALLLDEWRQRQRAESKLAVGRRISQLDAASLSGERLTERLSGEDLITRVDQRHKGRAEQVAARLTTRTLERSVDGGEKSA